jgi:lipopolysaccharide/colanic/teichoic acid biosynthesis glycosyltransferase
LEKYGTYAQTYLSVKPGLTGMWQVHGRSLTTYQERVLLDVNYVKNRCISGDIKLIAQTVGVVLVRKGAC